MRSREIDFGSKGGGLGGDDGKAKENAQQRDPTGLSEGERILSSTKCCQIRLGHPLQPAFKKSRFFTGAPALSCRAPAEL